MECCSVRALPLLTYLASGIAALVVQCAHVANPHLPLVGEPPGAIRGVHIFVRALTLNARVNAEVSEFTTALGDHVSADIYVLNRAEVLAHQPLAPRLLCSGEEIRAPVEAPARRNVVRALADMLVSIAATVFETIRTESTTIRLGAGAITAR